MRNVASQHRMNCPSVSSMDISSCPMLPSDKELIQAPSRQGKETKREGRAESGVRRQSYLTHHTGKRSRHSLFVRKTVFGEERGTMSAPNTTILALGLYVLDGGNSVFLNAVRNAPTTVDVQFPSTLRYCKVDGNRYSYHPLIRYKIGDPSHQQSD